MNNKVVIIGAGLGGLQCAYILSKNGFQVTVLEHDQRIGGCLQSFKRGNVTFDTGFHYVGGLSEGQSLYGLFRYFNLLNLPWHRLDEDCFDEVILGNEHFAFAQGHQNFVDTLAQRFPHQRQELIQYASFLQQVGNHLSDSFLPRDAGEFYSSSLFAKSAWNYLKDTITDPLLRKVLSGTSLKMELRAETLPLYIFAQINNSFIESAWRIHGGGQQIADALRRSIEAMGGVVRTSSTVTHLYEKEGHITQVEINGTERIEADWVISNAHPAATLNLIDDCPAIRKVYRRRIGSMQNTFGMFTSNIRLHPNTITYQNKNLFVHLVDADLWHPCNGRTESVLVNYYLPEDSSVYSPCIDLLTPMSWNQVAQWADKPRGHRGEDYVAFKENKTEECLQLIEPVIPDIRQAIDHIYTSTPLSYSGYTLTYEGSAYGVRKDYNNTLTTILTPRTPLKNLYLTGQNLNLHGVLGVSMTSVFTCAELLGMQTLVEDMDVKHWRE